MEEAKSTEKTDNSTSTESGKKTKSSRSAKSSSRQSASKEAVRGLVVVESPAKARTLKKYLGRNYDVKASVGHIKDLPKNTLGVDVENGFQPTYELIKGKKKIVDELTKAAKRVDEIFLGADPDREGEAIAWHVAEVLSDQVGKKIHRVLFNEITKPAVLKAMENPSDLNQDRYESQQARRILDRLVGYKISPLLWAKVRRGLSAGRVQSVAVRMVVEREKEIRAFQPLAYWEINAKLESSNRDLVARLSKIKGERVERTAINSESWAQQIVQACRDGQWRIESVQRKERQVRPYPPFITSTLQQEASRRLYFTAKKTMTLAQQLYEGVDLGPDGALGLITYMRTDSTRLSADAVREARVYIEKSLGSRYVPEAPVEYKSKKKAQDAHEAIRPTSLEFAPEKVKQYLDEDQWALYDLIWRRFLACQTSPSVSDQTTVEFEVAGSDGSPYEYRTSGSVLKFDGFRAYWPIVEDKNGEDDAQLPELDEKSPVKCHDVTSERKETQPPPRYTESSLIKELEEKGIGRPSTYATILSTIMDRKYVERKENRFYPTELGDLVTELLVENFGNIVDVGFTASMEDQLDEIEDGTREWKKTLREFYEPFEKTLKDAKKKMRNVKAEETPTSLKCPECSKDLVIKWGKNGKFVACQGYPACRFTSEYVQKEDGTISLVAQQVTGEKCPNCGSDMIVKMGRFGRFLACSSYPKCKTTRAMTTGIKCPECQQGELVERRTRFGKPFYSCERYPACKFALWNKPLKDRPCPKCNYPFLVEHYTKREGNSVRCPNKECNYREGSSTGASEPLASTGTQ